MALGFCRQALPEDLCSVQTGEPCIRNRGTEGVRTLAGLVLVLVCSEALNQGVVGILAQRIA